MEIDHVIDFVKIFFFFFLHSNDNFITMCTVCLMDIKRKSIFSPPTSSQEKKIKVKERKKRMMRQF